MFCHVITDTQVNTLNEIPEIFQTKTIKKYIKIKEPELEAQLHLWRHNQFFVSSSCFRLLALYTKQLVARGR